AKKPNPTWWKSITKADRYCGAACARATSFTCSNSTVISCSRRWRRSFDMEICRKGDALQVSDLDPFLAELLRQIPSSTNPEGEAEDLAQLNGKEKSLRNRTLSIPFEHADAWLNALNRARLVIASKYKFSDAELNDHDRSPIGSRRDLGLFQISFYGFLQEFILREMSG